MKLDWRALFLLLAAVPLEAGEWRGLIRDYQKSHRVLVVYRNNQSARATVAVRECGFQVVRTERSINGLKCRWDGNDAKKLRQMLDDLAAYPCIQLIEPDR